MAVFAGNRERAAAVRPQEQRVAQLAFIEPPIGANIQAVQDIYGRPGAPAANMRHSAVWACEDLIASMMSMLQPWAFKLPPEVFGVVTPNPGQGGTGQAGTPVKVSSQPRILNEPAAGMDIGDWLYAGTLSLMRGNVYGSAVSLTPMGFPDQVELQDPARCSVRQLANGTPEYKFNGRVQDASQPPVWHRAIFRGPGQLTGVSIMEFARRAIQLGLNAEQFANGLMDGASGRVVVPRVTRRGSENRMGFAQISA